jgi:uncharacterized protein
MSRMFAVSLIALTFLFTPVASGIAAEIANKRTVSVTGLGIVKARPDIASISIGVVSEGDTARSALDKNTAAMSRVNVELKGQKIKPEDIQTTSFSVRPKFQYFKDGKPPAITGYRVVNSVRITVRDLKNLGTVLDQAVSLGSNQINGIQFFIAESAALENQARVKAVKNARGKATLYATSAKAKLGKVLTISEQFISRPPQPKFQMARSDSAARPVPIAPGERKIQAQLNVVWELKD